MLFIEIQHPLVFNIYYDFENFLNIDEQIIHRRKI